jgi:hypothetical protein
MCISVQLCNHSSNSCDARSINGRGDGEAQLMKLGVISAIHGRFVTVMCEEVPVRVDLYKCDVDMGDETPPDVELGIGDVVQVQVCASIFRRSLCAQVEDDHSASSSSSPCTMVATKLTLIQCAMNQTSPELSPSDTSDRACDEFVLVTYKYSEL